MPSAPARPSGKVLVTTDVPEQRTAWTKARRDVLHLARQAGYPVLEMPVGLSPARWSTFLSALSAGLGPGGQVLLEYPFEQRLRLYPLVAFCRLHRVRLHGLIHDLNALRHDAPRGRELALLKRFDGLISHNAAMTAWLREGGVRRPVVEIGLFDYCTRTLGLWSEQSLSAPLKLVCASNLSYLKAGYLYDPRLGEIAGVELSLFGDFFEPQRPVAAPVHYRGVFDPDHPALDGRYHFGLVWDGSGVDRCEGRYGQYMRFNNPHKLSLYAALGLPVVVWEEAAVARFVREQGIGVTVRGLRELSTLAVRVGDAAYTGMVRRMREVGQAAREGRYLREALERLTTH